MAALELVVLGVGAGKTQTFDGEPSSSFGLLLDGEPLLQLDLGLGAVRAVHRHLGTAARFPAVYVSHNHTDHAGELPVLLAVEAAARASGGAGAPAAVELFAERGVLDTLRTHRLAELASTGQPLEHFARFNALHERRAAHIGGALSLLPLRSAHAERCYGLLVLLDGDPVLGWTADSGYDAGLLSELAAAPVVLCDARRGGGGGGTAEHAGFAQLQAAVESGPLRERRVIVYGYGRAADAPRREEFPGLTVATPGMRVALSAATASAPMPASASTSARVQEQWQAAINGGSAAPLVDSGLGGTAVRAPAPRAPPPPPPWAFWRRLCGC